MADEFEEVDAYPIRAFEFREAEGEPKLCLLRLNSGRGDKDGVIHSYAVSAEMLERLAREFLKQAKKMPRSHQS